MKKFCYLIVSVFTISIKGFFVEVYADSWSPNCSAIYDGDGILSSITMGGCGNNSKSYSCQGDTTNSLGSISVWGNITTSQRCTSTSYNSAGSNAGCIGSCSYKIVNCTPGSTFNTVLNKCVSTSACSGTTPCGSPGSCYAKTGCDNQCDSFKVNDCAGVCGGTAVDHNGTSAGCGVSIGSYPTCTGLEIDDGYISCGGEYVDIGPNHLSYSVGSTYPSTLVSSCDRTYNYRDNGVEMFGTWRKKCDYLCPTGYRLDNGQCVLISGCDANWTASDQYQCVSGVSQRKYTRDVCNDPAEQWRNNEGNVCTCSPPTNRTYTQDYQCNGTMRQQKQTGTNSCGTSQTQRIDTQTCASGCANGACISSCQGTVPSNAYSCNNLSPSSNISYSVVNSCAGASACTAACNPGYINNNGVCVARYTQYVCGAGGATCGAGKKGNVGMWTPNGSCTSLNYNSSLIYQIPSTVCATSAPTATCQGTCTDIVQPVCGSLFTCSPGSVGSQSSTNTCGANNTWTCSNDGVTINCAEAKSCPTVACSCDGNTAGGCSQNCQSYNESLTSAAGATSYRSCQPGAGYMLGSNSPQCSKQNPNTPVPGKCYDTIDASKIGECETGNPYGLAGGTNPGDTRTWGCAGIANGANTASNACSYTYPVVAPNGQCNNSIPGGCSAGTSSNSNAGDPGCEKSVQRSCTGNGYTDNCSYINNTACPVSNNGSCDNRSKFQCYSSAAPTSMVNGGDNQGNVSTWTCPGSNGGTNATNCSYTVPTIPINGVCGGGKFDCAAGFRNISLSNDGGNSCGGALSRWYCDGINGGSRSNECRYNTPACQCNYNGIKDNGEQGVDCGGGACGSCPVPVNGQCPISPSYIGQCSTSPDGINVDYTQRTWTCPGSNGGSSMSCRIAWCGNGLLESGEGCDAGGSNTNQCNSAGSVCSTTCQVIPRCCNPVDSTTSSCNGIDRYVRNQGVRADCSTYDSNVLDPRPYGQCCNNGSYTPAPAWGSNKGGFGCNAKWINRTQSNGDCGVMDVAKQCTDTVGWSVDRIDVFGANNIDRTSYTCNQNKCTPTPIIQTTIYLCTITGTNVAQNCLNALPVNMPYGAAYVNGGTTIIGDQKTNNKFNHWEEQNSLYVGLRDASNNPVLQPDYGGGYRPNPGLPNVNGYPNLTVGATYHSYVTTSPTGTGSQFPSGWVMISGPSPDAITYNQSHHLVLGGGSLTGSSLIRSGYRIVMGNDYAYANYYFYCSLAGGCPVPRRLNVNTFYDKANDGLTESYAYENENVAQMFISVYDAGGVRVASGYTVSGNQPDYYNVGNGSINNQQGTFDTMLMSDQTYTVVITPKSGFTGQNTAPYHYVSRDDMPGANVPAGVSKTVISPLSFRFVMPRDRDVYTRTRMSGISANLSLKHSIVNPKLGYNVGDIVKVKYTVKNEGFNHSDQTQILTSIITGLQSIPSSVTYSGLCDYYYGTSNPRMGADITWQVGAQSPNTPTWICDATQPHGYPGCAFDYANRSLITWTDNGSGPMPDNSIYSTTYPASVTDLNLAYSQDNYYSSYKKLVPKGSTLSLGRGGDGNADMPAGALCEITLDYQVVAGVTTGQTYTYRSCIKPRDRPDTNPTWLADNCDNFQVRIGLPECTVPVSMSGALLAGTSTRLPGGAKVAYGSGIVAWADDLVAPGESTYCQSEVRVCDGNVFSGSFTNVSCMKQCEQVRSGGQIEGVTPGSVTTGWNTLRADLPTYNCECRQSALTCSPRIITPVSGDNESDPGGRSYIGGTMVGPLSSYPYPGTESCSTVAAQCDPACVDNMVDLYEVHYGMSGNIVLGNNRVIDQVHPNICINPSTFTGRLATNEVRITFYSGASESLAISGLTNITGSLMKNVGSGLICGPYVQYEFVNPLYPGAEGYFFYQYKLKESISVNPNANSGDNCIWIYRQDNNEYRNPSNAITEIEAAALSSLDPGDVAQRFLNISLPFIKFNTATELINNNRVCVPPPTSICPANEIVQTFSIPLNLCGNGVQEVGEQCDDGHAPYNINGRNNNDGSIRYTGLNITDPLYDNYCKRDCTLGKPLVCNWVASCNNSNIDSIQVGEQYPFWWNLGESLPDGQQYNSGFTRVCTDLVHANKIMYGGSYPSPTCTFSLTNGLSTGGNSVYQFTAPCFGTGESSIPMFNLSGSKMIAGDIPISDGSSNINRTITSAVTNSIGTKLGTLKEFKKYLTSSQGSKIITITSGMVQGQYGEYALSLTKISYNYCNVSANYIQDGNGNNVASGYIYSVASKTESARLCSNRFIVTNPYIVQEGSLLSTVPLRDFRDFYTTASRLIDQSAEGTFSKGVKVNNTQVATYVSMISTTTGSSNKEFVYRFIDKYTQLAISAGEKKLYTHKFDSTITGPSTDYELYKIPTREIYIYTGTSTLILSDYAFRQSNTDTARPNPFNTADNFTIIAPYADVTVLGDLQSRIMMILTKKNMRFAGGSLSEDPQKVDGIFVSSGYAGVTLKNDNVNQRWIDDGRLVVNGLLISSDIQNLANQRRSIIKDWYDGTLDAVGGSALIAKKREKLIEGASLRIIPNPALFVSPPPGSTELLQSLSIAK